MTQALAVAAEFGIADQLASGPRSVEELAAATQTHAPSLHRVLRALASVGVFAETEPQRFTLTPLAELLRRDAPGSQRAMAIMMGGEFHATWGELLHSARTGEPGFHHRFGSPFFEYMQQHPDRHAIYDAAMQGVHGGETEPMIAAYDFSHHATVADIGGGNGSTLATLLQRHPKLQGILFDLPDVAKRAGEEFACAGVADRCRIVGGDFFKGVPAGADACVLRHVLHDWQDDEAIAILRNCRAALPPEGRVLVVEFVLPPGNAPGFGKWLDLMMLLVAGRERTEAEFRRLFAAAGLELKRTLPTTAEVCVLEAEVVERTTHAAQAQMPRNGGSGP
jgi:SAM-dependent methyltransferase